MDGSYLGRFGFGAAEAVARIFRKSLLTDATNFRSGTLCSSSRFFFSSMEHSYDPS